MKLYRVHMWSSDGSAGYSYHSSLKGAKKAKRLWDTDNAEDVPDTNGATVRIYEAEIAMIVVSPTKKGILDALNQYADHPNNG